MWRRWQPAGTRGSLSRRPETHGAPLQRCGAAQTLRLPAQPRACLPPPPGPGFSLGLPPTPTLARARSPPGPLPAHTLTRARTHTLTHTPDTPASCWPLTDRFPLFLIPSRPGMRNCKMARVTVCWGWSCLRRPADFIAHQLRVPESEYLLPLPSTPTRGAPECTCSTLGFWEWLWALMDYLVYGAGEVGGGGVEGVLPFSPRHFGQDNHVVLPCFSLIFNTHCHPPPAFFKNIQTSS